MRSSPAIARFAPQQKTAHCLLSLAAPTTVPRHLKALVLLQHKRQRQVYWLSYCDLFTTRLWNCRQPAPKSRLSEGLIGLCVSLNLGRTDYRLAQ